MSKEWKSVKLGEVIRQRKEFIEIDDLQTYKRARVQLHAKGIVLRDVVEGSMVKTKRQQVSRAGEFLVAEIDAKVGGFGIVPDELDGAVVSSHYFLFEIDDSKLERRFLDFFIRTPSFRDQVEAQGSTNYAAIRPAHVLAYEIPLPPLAEQRRIVARIEALAAEIAEAKILRQEAWMEAEATFHSCVNELLLMIKSNTTFGTTCRIVRGKSPIYDPNSEAKAINQKCIRWQGIDQLHAKRVSESWLSKLSPDALIQEDDLLVNSTGEGTIGRGCLASLADVGLPFDSHVLAVRRLEPTILEPRFLEIVLQSRSTQSAIEEMKGATTTKQTELGVTKLGEIKLPLPSVSEQRRIVAELDALQAQVDGLKRLQSETAAELDALLPAILDRAFKGEL